MPVVTADPEVSPQPSLWDALTRVVRPRPKRPVSRRGVGRGIVRRRAERPTDPPAPGVSAREPLRVGPPWPARDVALVVDVNVNVDVDADATAARRYSFRRALWCGAQCYALLAPWEQRDDGMAGLVSVEMERVRGVAQGDRVDDTSKREEQTR